MVVERLMEAGGLEVLDEVLISAEISRLSFPIYAPREKGLISLGKQDIIPMRVVFI